MLRYCVPTWKIFSDTRSPIHDVSVACSRSLWEHSTTVVVLLHSTMAAVSVGFPLPASMVMRHESGQ